MYDRTYSKSVDQPGKVVNPARGQVNREMDISLSPPAPENLVSRDGFASPVPRQPAHLHTQTESGASSPAASIHLFQLLSAIGSVPSLSGHAVADR